MIADLPYIFLTVFGIGFIIFIHELGHYMAARAVGVRVEAFSIGFGPRLFGWTRGPTEYKVSLIPLGGYVKMAGEDPTRPTTGQPDEFGSKTVGQRVLVISAGVIMNMIFALIAIPIAFTIGVPFDEPRIGAVTPGGPAWEAGLEQGDLVLAVNDRPILTYEDVILDAAVADGPAVFTVERNGERLDRVVQARDDDGVPRIGIGIAFREMSISPTLLDPDEDHDKGLARVAAQIKQAGLTADDRIVRINGIPMEEGYWHLVEWNHVRTTAAPMTLMVKRHGTAERTVVLDPVMEVDDEVPLRLGLAAGGPQIRILRPGSDAARSGLQVDDVVFEVAGRPLESLRDLALILGEDTHIFARPEDQDPEGAPPANPTITLSVWRGWATNQPARADVSLSLPTWSSRRRLLDDIAWQGVKGRALWVTAGSPAFEAGMRTGDVLLQAGDRKAHTFRSILEEVEDKKKGASVKLQVQRGPEILEFTVSPVRQPVNVTLSGLVHERPTWKTQIPFPESLEVAVIHTGRTITRIVQTLGSLFRGAVAPKHLGGIITIFRVSKDQSKVGLMRGLLFLAMVSINLAILNILPIPVLDGGWLMFLTIEKIKGSPVSERAMAYFQWAGLIFILGLMGFVTYNDIVRLF